VEWDDLDRELAAWAAMDRPATFWWRDDDAITASRELEQLVGLSENTGVSLGLAVIPASADESLPEFLHGHPNITVLQHGYAHKNHADSGEEKCELGHDRPLDTILQEQAVGRARLRALFGRQQMPVMVPPWNRIAPLVADALPNAGFVGLSTFGALPRVFRTEGLRQVNSHINVLNWHGDHGFVGPQNVLAQAVKHLTARRTGVIEDIEPTGLLTHHLAQDESCWAFIAEFLHRTLDHPAVRWIALDKLFSANYGDR
jgi:hypothetical protein